MQISVGIDAAKEVHWATAVTQDGRVLLDRKILNTAEDIGRLATELAAMGGERLVGIDLLGSIATLLSAMLLAAGERLVHVPGLAVNRARQGSVGGQNKSDPKDARVIADQLRLRPGDFRPITVQDETVAELHLLVRRRTDLVVDQTRRNSRMRYLLNTIHPDLERALDLTKAGPMLLLTRYVTAAQIRAAGPKTIARFLRAKGVRNPEALADAAYTAALAHPDLRLPAEATTASLVREIAEEAVACRTRIAAIERTLEKLVQAHPDGASSAACPGWGSCSPQSSWPRQAMFPASDPPPPWPAPPASHPCCASPARSGTCTGRATPTTGSSGYSTNPPSARSPTRSAGPSTHASAWKENNTTKPSSPSLAGALTCWGP